jgi:hypothetical protein
VTAGQSTRRFSNVSLAPSLLAAVLAVTLLSGALIGAAVRQQVGSMDAKTPAAGAAAQPAATFDIEKHRGEVDLGPAERAPVVAKPGAGINGSGHRDPAGGP